MRDPWIVLDLQRSANDEEIKERYRLLARQLHPDRNPGNMEAAQRFQDVSWAYDVIRTEERRLRWQAENESTLDWSGEPAAEGKLNVSFLEAFRGTEKSTSIEVEEACRVCAGSGAAPGSAPRRCSSCDGSGSITLAGMKEDCQSCEGRGYTIPVPCDSCSWGRRKATRDVLVRIAPGVHSGQRIVVADGSNNLSFRIEVDPSPVFERSLPDPADLLLHVPVSFAEALLGAAVRIPTPEKVVEMQIPPGSSSGKNFRIQGAGMPREDGTRGDLYARLAIEVPSDPSGSLRRLAEKIQEEEEGDALRARLFHF